MTWKMLILGVVQGLTEFLPISSSGHLLLGEKLLGIEQEALAVTIFLHVGTLVASVVFMARRIGKLFSDMFARDRERRKEGWMLVLYLVIACIPAALVGLLAGDFVETIFTDKPIYVAFFFIGTGALLLATRWGRQRDRSFGLSDAILVGIAQAVAILPGFSRSGLTIATALLLGIASLEAFNFSFLLSIPAITGAALIEFLELSKITREGQIGEGSIFSSPLPAIAGFVASAVVGFFALWALKKVVVSRKFWLFSFYCFGIGLVSLVLLLFLR
ncbi:undecaprenyl-diphosphate phosphatase [candidate division WOR-3 bacterium]|nr:undecaprenyl-diphosphate phosphatase [candidate division WOR-3 bacterium]